MINEDSEWNTCEKTSQAVSDSDFKWNAARFKKTMQIIGGALLFFTFILWGGRFLFNGIWKELEPSLSENTAFLLSELISDVLYVVSFLAPIPFLLILFHFCIAEKRVPLLMRPKGIKRYPLYLFAGICIVFVAARVNAILVSVFHYSEFTSNVLFNLKADTPLEIVLLVLSTAVIPAIVEELLFRGTILNQLRPYGTSVAVVISAILFGLMHMNAGQFFYTTVAGIVFGLVYLKTHSIFASVFLHFLNNFISVVESVCYTKLTEAVAGRVCGMIELSMILIGGICILILALKKDLVSTEPENLCDSISLIPVRRKAVFSGFFCPTIIIFIVWSALQMAELILASVMYAAGGM